MTLRTGNWQLDLIGLVSVICTVVSVWLVWREHQLGKQARRRHLIGAEADLVPLPLAGALFRLAASLTWLAFALVLLTVKRPGEYPLLAFFVLGQAIVPAHSFLLLRRKRRAIRKIPQSTTEEATP